MSGPFSPELEGELPAPGASFLAHSLAGAAAGMAETAAMYPLDTIKTRMQASATLPHTRSGSTGCLIPFQTD